MVPSDKPGTVVFTVPPEKMERLEKWKAGHEGEGYPGRYVFIFTPGLPPCCTLIVEDTATGETVDLTDYNAD